MRTHCAYLVALWYLPPPPLSHIQYEGRRWSSFCSGSDCNWPCNFWLLCILLLFWIGQKTNAELDNYFKYIVSEGRIVSGTMFIIIKLLFAAILFNMSSCVSTCIHKVDITQFLVLWHVMTPDLLFDAMFNYTWYDTPITTCSKNIMYQI